MPKITFDQAREFLDNITSKDKVAIIHHDDLDGFASGILFYDWCKQKGTLPEHFVYLTETSSIKDYDLTKFNKILITDLAPNLIAAELESIKDKQILYTDHHLRTKPVPKEILEYQTTDEGYIPSSRTVQELTQLKPWLGVAGTVGDAGDYYPENMNYINKILKKENITLDKFKENVTSIISNTIIYFKDNLQEVFQILDKIDSTEEIKQLEKYSQPVEDELQKFVEKYDEKKEKLGNINFYYFESEFYIKVPLAAIISRQDFNQTYIFATPRDENTISLGARNQSKKKDMAELLRIGIKGLKNARTGGHIPAAGGSIQKKDLKKFKENIKNYLIHLEKATSETRKREKIIEKIKEDLSPFVHSIIIVGSMAYGKNYSIRKDSDIDLLILVEKTHISKLLNYSLFNKDPWVKFAIKYLKEDLIQVFTIKKLIKDVKIEFHIWNKDTQYKATRIEIKKVKRLKQDKSSTAIIHKDFSGKSYFIKKNIFKFKDYFIQIYPVYKIINKNFVSFEPINNMVMCPNIIFSRDKKELLKNIEFLWEKLTKQLIKENPSLDLFELNVLNSQPGSDKLSPDKKKEIIRKMNSTSKDI